MQFQHNKRHKSDDGLGENESDGGIYRYWINFYTHPPDQTITMQEVENMIVERMKMLAVIDTVLKMLDKEGFSKNRMFHDVMHAKVTNVKAANNDKNFYVAGQPSKLTPLVIQARKRDHFSHYLLRLYYCQNAELRKWFIRMETELFRMRLNDLPKDTKKHLADCLSHYGLDYKAIDEVERAALLDDISLDGAIPDVLIKLRFEEAAELVRQKRVFLKDGFAYIPPDAMTQVLCGQFRTSLSRALTRMHALFYRLDEDRLLARLDSLHKQHVASNESRRKRGDADETTNNIYADEIDRLAGEAFPPCMRSIHDKLRADHHLKHYGRLHYGLFLRSAGLPLDEALNFFRAEYSIINPQKFEKEYAYSIRYSYGKEGKRVANSAYGCQKIINDNPPGPGDSHGCPFKHFDDANLRAMLVRYGVNKEEDLEQIMTKATKDRNFTGACTRFFAAKYDGSLPEKGVIYHPNQFFKDARNILQGGSQQGVSDNVDG